MYVLDASLLVSAFFLGEPKHRESRKILDSIRRKEAIVFEPEILFPEVAAALARGTGSTEPALTFCAELRALSNFYFTPVDSYLADLAASCAARLRLRGADAIYVALASLRGATLVTLDREQYERAKSVITIQLV